MPTAAQHIAMTVYPAWAYYRARVCVPTPDESILAERSCEQIQKLMRVYPKMDRVKVAFLAHVARIITGQDPAKNLQIVFGREPPPVKYPPAKVIRSVSATMTMMD